MAPLDYLRQTEQMDGLPAVRSTFSKDALQSFSCLVDEILPDRAESLNRTRIHEERNMTSRTCKVMTLGLLTIWGTWIAPASAQPISPATHEEAPPLAAPAESAGPLTLDACIDLGMAHQPSLDAARASLSAAATGKRALDRLIFARLFAPDLGVRRQQASLGVTIASASLTQAEWETRYAITRNFFTVQYVHLQQQVINEALENLQKSRARAVKLHRSGAAEVKITKLDIDTLDVQLALVKSKKSQADNGLLKATAALREAMGLGCDFPLQLAATGLPQEVYAVKKIVLEKEKVAKKDKDGKVVKDKDGNEETIEQVTKKEVITYHRLYKFDKQELIASAQANRGELVQASTLARVVELEECAQNRIRGWQGRTFAMGSDPHATPIPQGTSNGDYRPGAIGPEMPPMLAGRKHDRVARAADFAARAAAVVDKTHSLVSLDVEAQYLKWLEAAEDIEDLSEVVELATGLPGKVLALDLLDFTANAVIQANIGSVMVRSQLNEARHMHALALAGLERATAGAVRVYPVPQAPTMAPK
jgi:hypothetical protein